MSNSLAKYTSKGIVKIGAHLPKLSQKQVRQQDTNPPYGGGGGSLNYVQHPSPLFQWMAHIFAYSGLPYTAHDLHF